MTVTTHGRTHGGTAPGDAPDTRKQWFPGLDGLRALAFLTIFFLHQRPPGPVQLHGGYAGVDLFFVLSGFLITTLLLQEFGRSGRIDVKKFYLRRLVRLTPILLAFCAAVFALSFVDSDLKAAGTSIRWHAVGALTYSYNWIAIHTFSSGHDTRYLGPMWSLSVEEQFYAVWPLVMFFVLRRSVRSAAKRGAPSATLSDRIDPHLLVRLLVAGIVISNALRVLFGVAGDAYFRALWGTDVNSSALLIGALGAVVRLLLPGAMAKVRSLLPVLTPLATVMLAGLFLRLPEAPSKAPFAGGLLAVHLCSIVLILGVVERSVPFVNVIFELSPLRWIGRISYGAYVVHFFFVVRLGGHIRVPWLINLVISLVIAGLSFRFFEQPVARYFRNRWHLDQSSPANDPTAPHPHLAS